MTSTNLYIFLFISQHFFEFGTHNVFDGGERRNEWTFSKPIVSGHSNRLVIYASLLAGRFYSCTIILCFSSQRHLFVCLFGYPARFSGGGGGGGINAIPWSRLMYKVCVYTCKKVPRFPSIEGVFLTDFASAVFKFL